VRSYGDDNGDDSVVVAGADATDDSHGGDVDTDDNDDDYAQNTGILSLAPPQKYQFTQRRGG